MARMPPDRAPAAPLPLTGRFVLPDGRKISINPHAVSAVYDQPDRSEYATPMAVIAVGHTNLLVPYTHDEVLGILTNG